MTNKVYTMDDFSEMIEAKNNGEIVEIDEDVYYYFLEVLPPVVMRSRIPFRDGEKLVDFGMTEGMDYVDGFWRKEGRYFAQKSEMMNPYW